MTEIRIQRLCLENFKCHKCLQLTFDGGNATVYGDNASGKTSIYDAFVWLLFGKDSSGNGEKNIEIKPLDESGEVKDHLAVTAVEAVLSVSGEEVTLRRTYKEVWSTKRGSAQPTYDGNTSEYYVNGVPCKKNAFQDKVNQLVSEDSFRMLTSVSHFAAGISWQDRRAVLFQVAGVMDDDQIMATDERFLPLAESKGKLTLEDYKKKLLAEKRQLVGAKTEIPARLSECRKTVEEVEGLDFAGAMAEAEALRARQDGIAQQILDLDSDSAAEKKRMEIRRAQLELSKLENDNKAYRDSQTAALGDTRAMERKLAVLEMNLASRTDSLVYSRDLLQDQDARIAASRSRWITVNGERFSADNCPTCGQKLPQQQLQKAMDTFETGKRERLADIEQAANVLKKAREDTVRRIESLDKEVGELRMEIAEARKQLTQAQGAVAQVRDMEGFRDQRDAIAAGIDALSGELADISQNAYDRKEALRREKEGLARRITELLRIVNKEALLEHARQREAQLRQDAKNTAECLDAIEKMLYLMDEYSRYKTRFVEDSINGKFRIARFRLFREQANGGTEDRCDVVYDGIPYINVNNGMKINLGIDIINTLSRAYGVRVPLFVDNAESVTALESCASQMIRLAVSKNDKELRVDYEN